MDVQPSPAQIATAQRLCDLLDASPSPFHAAQQLTESLVAAGYRVLAETDDWTLAPGDKVVITRDGSSVIALQIGTHSPVDHGFRIVGAHTDSPTFAIRPNADIQERSALLGIEVYGGPLMYTWLDRDLTAAGRVFFADGSATNIVLDGTPLRIPSLAIHLDRGANDGLSLNPQQHLRPLLSADKHTTIEDLIEKQTGRTPVSWDLVLSDTQPSTLGGAHQEFVFGPRQDNLVSCFAGRDALLQTTETSQTQVLACFDHEEVGSRSSKGAAGPFLADVLDRVVNAFDPSPDGRVRAYQNSIQISADAAHAVHPNHGDKHEPKNCTDLGSGPAIKHHVGQAYATNAATTQWFIACCEAADVPYRHVANRADMRSGSTIGPISATRLGIPTVDIGNPMLSMHSIREQTATTDLSALTAALAQHFSRDRQNERAGE